MRTSVVGACSRGVGAGMDDGGTILCPLDLSGISRVTLVEGAALADRLGACLVVLYVEHPLLVTVARQVYGIDLLGAHAEREVRAFVESILTPAFGPQRPAFRILITAGSPAAEILSAAQRVNAALIVMGTHGLHGLAGLIGSTAARVMRRGTVPVLVVPPLATFSDAGTVGRRVRGPSRL